MRHSILWLNDIPLYGQTTFCLFTLSQWASGWSHLLNTPNEAAMNTSVRVFG